MQIDPLNMQIDPLNMLDPVEMSRNCEQLQGSCEAK